MGCTQSKIENEEAVSRCKDRKLFMKAAVTARNAFSAAHSAYTTSLKNTGAAMSDYAHGEVQNPQHVAHSQSLPASLSAASQPPLDPLLPPPPPPALSTFQTPIQRAASMPEIKMPKREMESGVGPIMEEESDDEDDMESPEKLVTRKKSSNSNGPKSDDQKQSAGPTSPERPPPSAVDTQSHPYGWDYFFPEVENIPATTLEEVKMDKAQMETERKVVDEIPKREEEDAPEKLVARHDRHEQPPPPPPPSAMEEEKVMPPPGPGVGGESVGRNSKKGNNAVGGSGGVAGEKKVEKRNVNLLQIFTDLDDHFLKASESAQEVSKMLEATRLHYHSNFADNRGHIDHSATVLRVITWNRSFRMPNVDVVKDDFDSEENETHATVLDKLLAWEKKLYDEVKAGELMKFDYQRKVAMLNKAKKRGTNSDALEKIKATVSHLHTRYIVDMQSLDSTVMEINRLRDEQLYPKLVQLVDGMASMWRTMQEHHESQLKIVSALRYVGLSQCPKETTDHHHQRTIQLWAVVREWHTQFCKLIDHQKEYVKALNNWLRLNLIPIESNLKEKVSSPPRVHTPPIQRLLFHWHDYLGKLPDDVARPAISNFAAVVETIMQHQEEEIKLKLRCEETRKELSRKTRMFEDWYHKYMQKRTPEELETDESMVKDAVAERQFQVEVVRKRLEEEEEAYQKQCIQVREKSLASLKNRLPELFRAMYDIAYASSRMYEDLWNISQRRNQSESVS